jgi:uncharacterized protein
MAEPVPVCAYCRERPVEAVWRPFCSERCKMADLGRWFSGDYRIPGTPVPNAEDEDAEDAD